MKGSRFLPALSEKYEGSPIALYFLVLVTVVSTVRSLIHIFAPDGGVNSIAGLVIAVEGGTNLVAMFAQWGASQLILALFYWLAILRYRFLVPFMLFIVFVEQALRIGVGQLKPIEVVAPPPGEIGSYVLLPLSLIAFILSLRQTAKAT
ncbi:MAG: hypothetical protein JXR84_05370 [Anaerolineae bacterium]|nr:hypothetical protein [Anaerolineae bacterium]